MQIRRILLSILILSVTATGCATTTVKKDPGPHDKGIRYYRPKPYLLLQPHQGNSPDYVSIMMQYMPDFSEEYSIRAHSGLGWNKTEVTLSDGWNLTNIKQELDSQTDENLNALANLASKFVAPSEGNAQPGTPALVVKAKNVPFGYYESVISRGQDGRKRLYGWRYVGFMPFNQCPVVSGGVECQDCYSSVIYALAFEEGTMVFVPMTKLQDGPAVTKGLGPAGESASSVQTFEKRAPGAINAIVDLKLADGDVKLKKLSEVSYTAAVFVAVDKVATANSNKSKIEVVLDKLVKEVIVQQATIKVDIIAKGNATLIEAEPLPLSFSP